MSCPDSPAPWLLCSFSSRAARWERPGSSRCFKTLLVCPAPGSGDPTYVWRTAQFMVQHYKSAGLDPRLNFSAPASAPVKGAPPGAAERILRIVFHQRPGKVRQILNFQEVFRACTLWSYYSATTRTTYRASCAWHPLKDVPTAIQVAQQTDVFIAMHGEAAQRPSGCSRRPAFLLAHV